MLSLPGLYGRLTDRGFRLTLPHQALLNVFASDPEHPTADKVFMQVHKRYPGIGLASSTQRSHHHHMVCRQYGQIIDCSDFMDKEVGFVRELERELSRRHEFKIDRHEIHFCRPCKECQCFFCLEVRTVLKRELTRSSTD